MKIAVAGKGGVGKTLVASGLAWALARSGYKTIAIDADPSPNLALSLGLDQEVADAIIPVSENERLIKLKTGTAFPGVYNLNFSVDDVVRDYAIPTPSGVHLLVMGTVKSMGSGCTCASNSVIRALLRHLVIDRDEAVVLDMEAGIEHLGRGTAEGVDMMIVVSDANKKSLTIAGTIVRMALDAGIPRVELAGNRITNITEETIIKTFAQEHNIPVVGIVPFDPAIMAGGIAGSSVMAFENTPAIRMIEEIGHRIELVKPAKGNT
ncbi:MAG: P-loop NTPase [Methanocalculus sp.]|uniref:ATP-binding protein n=1 Tax=Methanocalculus sp. TaxID=2004547 RepID=UPI002725AA34|nr:P-loop NTPase [Methanocalculus sp.]MDO9540499.1 P-loop NTPase [Methanocalculus sp.]